MHPHVSVILGPEEAPASTADHSSPHFSGTVPEPAASKSRNIGSLGGDMFKKAGKLLLVATVSVAYSLAHAQDPQTIIQQAVDAERAANRSDNTNWIYLEQIDKPRENVRQWVATTEHGNVDRVVERNEQKLPETQQRELIERFIHDPKAEKKQISESNHDYQQVDDFLKLLPTAFHWTQTGITATDVLLHFEPDPEFHPPTREARVFSGMTGDITIDRQQHRVASMSGLLTRDITFGGGLLGRLKKGSSFSLEQTEVGNVSWQLTSIRVHLEGSALLFKSISLQQDDKRSRFQPEPSDVSLNDAFAAAMRQPD